MARIGQPVRETRDSTFRPSGIGPDLPLPTLVRKETRAPAFRARRWPEFSRREPGSRAAPADLSQSGRSAMISRGLTGEPP